MELNTHTPSLSNYWILARQLNTVKMICFGTDNEERFSFTFLLNNPYTRLANMA